MTRSYLMLAVLSVTTTSVAVGAISTYTAFGPWQSVAGETTTLGFVEFPTGTIIGAQYASLGFMFPDGDDFVLNGFPTTYPQDGAGLRDFSTGSITVELSQSRLAVALHYPGLIQIDLYSGRELLFSNSFQPGFIDNFTGLTSTLEFDSVVISDPDGEVNIDNLYFGAPIPAPGALGTLAFAFLKSRRRRER